MLGEAREEPSEITASELPGEGSGRLLLTLLEGEEAFGQSVEVGQVVGAHNLALDHREVDLDLIEPGGINRKVEEPQIRPLSLKALDRGFPSMGGAVVHDPEHAIRRGVGFLSLITCSTREPKGSMPFLDSQRPKSFARCTSQAAR